MAQLVRAPPCHGGGRGFESHSGRLQETLSVDCLIKLKADDRTRTDNLLITNQLLCQLSHIGISMGPIGLEPMTLCL